MITQPVYRAAPLELSGGQHGSLDFVHDQVARGRMLSVLTVIDKWHRQCVAREVNHSLTGQRVVDALNGIAPERDPPHAIAVDHGTEFASRALDEWCFQRGVKLDFVRPGKSTENAFYESFNGHLRDGCLNVNAIATRAEAKTVL